MVMALWARPDVALAIDSDETPDQAPALLIRGHAGVEIVDGVVPENRAAARKTMDAEAAAEFEQNVRVPLSLRARSCPCWSVRPPSLPHVPSDAGRAEADEVKVTADQAPQWLRRAVGVLGLAAGLRGSTRHTSSGPRRRW